MNSAHSITPPEILLSIKRDPSEEASEEADNQLSDNNPDPVDDEESAESLIARAEEIIRNNREYLSCMRSNRDQESNRSTRRDRLETMLFQTDERLNEIQNVIAASDLTISEVEDSLNAAEVASVNRAMDPIPIVSSDEDDDVVFVSAQPTNLIAVVDLSNSINENIPRPRNASHIPLTAPIPHQCRRKNNSEPLQLPQPPVNVNPVNVLSSPKPSNQIPNTNCAVCMDNVFANRPTSTICGHIFCYTCIIEAIKICRKCPICNKRLTAKQVHRVYL